MALKALNVGNHLHMKLGIYININNGISSKAVSIMKMSA
jgi:hypothetical protein